MNAKATFAELEAAGLARIRCEPEEEAHDLSYIDSWDVSEEEREKAKRETLEQIDRDGLWYYVAEYREHESLPWENVYSVGDCIGELDAAYAADARRAVEEAHVEAKQRAWFAQGARCGHLEGKAGRTLHLAGLPTIGAEALEGARLDGNAGHAGQAAVLEWAAGYLHGYALSIVDRELPDALRLATLPDSSCVPVRA